MERRRYQPQPDKRAEAAALEAVQSEAALLRFAQQLPERHVPSATSLATLFLLATAACSNERASQTATDVSVEQSVSEEGELAQPELSEQLKHEMDLFQHALLKIESQGHPVELNGLTVELDFKQPQTLRAAEEVVDRVLELSYALSDELTIHLEHADPKMWAIDFDDAQLSEGKKFRAPAYQLMVENTGDGEPKVRLLNWIAEREVSTLGLPEKPQIDTESLADEIEFLQVDEPVSETAYDREWKKALEKKRAAVRVVTRPLQAAMQLQDSLVRDWENAHEADAQPFVEYRNFLLAQSESGRDIGFSGYTLAVDFEDDVPLHATGKGMTSIRDAVTSLQEVGIRAYDQFVDPLSVAKWAIDENPEGKAVAIPAYAMNVTVGTFLMKVEVIDWRTGETIYSDYFPTEMGEVDYEGSDTEFLPLLQENADEDTPVYTAPEPVDDPVATATANVISSIGADKMRMREDFARLRGENDGTYLESDTEILIPTLVEGSGMKSMNELFIEHGYDMRYSILPSDRSAEKEAVSVDKLNYGFANREYAGTMQIDGQITRLEFSRLIGRWNREHEKMRPGVSMSKDQFGNVILREIEHEGPNYVERLTVLVHIPFDSTDGNESVKLSLDLSHFDLGVHEDFLYHKPEKRLLEVHETGKYDVFSRAPDLDFEKNEAKLIAISEGMAEAERIFGFAPGTFVRNIMFIDTDKINAHYAYDKPTTIVIEDEFFKKQGIADHWNVGFHETVHLIVDKFELADDPQLIKEYSRTFKPMLEGINEKVWFDEVTVGGHAQDNLNEAFPSIIRAATDEDFEEKMRSSEWYDVYKRDFSRLSAAMADAIEQRIELYRDTGAQEMDGYGEMTVHIALRNAAKIALESEE